MAEHYSTVYVHHIFFIHSPVDGHPGCFRVLARVNSGVMTIEVHVSFRTVVFLGHMPNTGISGLYGRFIPRFFFFF